MSALVGYLFGDYCLFNSYLVIGAGTGQGLGLVLSKIGMQQYADAPPLMALTPALIILPYCLIHRQRIRIREIIGVLVSMTGVALFFLL
ncbi:MAG: hypothetical protein IJ654_07250 [Bacteroidales bacterium]|nr:hypothetical protein [Bacteroidales bacterium]